MFYIGENGYLLSCICGCVPSYVLFVSHFDSSLVNPMVTLYNRACSHDFISLDLEGDILCRVFNMDMVKKIDDLSAQVARVKNK